MAQPIVTNGSVNGMDPTNAKDINEVDRVKKEIPPKVQNQTQANQPNVRHIPIFVEGRDEPLFNRNIDTVDAPISRPATVLNDIPQSGSIFSRVKDIPVKKNVPEYQANNIGRSSSPGRTIPINVVHTKTNTTPGGVQQQHPNQQAPQQEAQQIHPQQQPQLNAQKSDRRSQSPKPLPIDPITKIQNIQKEMLELMDKVEKFKGGSRKDKEYLYLDEMLTQNLLKLDTIDTEGKESIKAARKEAIKCINKCIQILEAKTESAGNSENANSSQDDTCQQSKQESNLQPLTSQEDSQQNKQNTNSPNSDERAASQASST